MEMVVPEMAEMGKETREITDSLDEVGNSTAAIGKGFAISAAALAAHQLDAGLPPLQRVHEGGHRLALAGLDRLGHDLPAHPPRRRPAGLFPG